MIFVVSLPMSRSSLLVQQSPSAPYWRSCTGEEMKSAMIDVSYAASQTQILKPIHSKAIASRLDLFLTVMCTMTSYAAADCHFRQDAHRRMASVLARIRCAEMRELGERARDHQTVHGEKLYMSVTYAECMEVEYATERYSKSPPPDGTKTDNGDTATRNRRRGFAQRIQVELDFSSDEAPTSSRSIYLREIHRQIDHNEGSSAGLLTAQSSVAMQSTLPLAKETLLHIRRFVPSPWLCPMPLFHRSIGGNCAQASALAPLGGVCGRPRLLGIRYIFSALFGSISVRDCSAGSSDTLRRSLHGTRPAASSQDTNEGFRCCCATSETARLCRHCKGRISDSGLQKLCTERGLYLF